MTTTVAAMLHSMSDACQALTTVPGTLYNKETEAWKSEVTCLTEGPSANEWHSLNYSMIPQGDPAPTATYSPPQAGPKPARCSWNPV